MPKAADRQHAAAARRIASKQVMLQVRFAEVNRNALLQAGVHAVHDAQRTSRRARRRSSSPAPISMTTAGGSVVCEFSDFLNLFFF